MPSLMEYLITLAARIRARGEPFPPSALPPPDDDPDARVRQPRSSPQGGRGSAVAVDEPKDIETIQVRCAGRGRS